MDHEHTHQHAHGIEHSHGHVHENQKAVINRLARAIGHLEKVKRMVEEGYDCSDVLVQLAAVRSALDNTGKVILQDHMRHCMVDAVAAGDTDAIDDLCQAIDNTGKVILQDHMRHCMVDAVACGDEDAIEDLCRAIERYMK